MVEWLERIDEDEPSDIEVWHLQKTQYTFKDLGVWKQEGTLDKEYQMWQQKEKGKAKARMSQRKEKRRMAESKNGGDEPEMSRKEKGSGGKSKVLKASTSKSQK